MPPGLVIIMAVLMALAVPRSRLGPPVPDAGPPGQIPGLAAAVTRWHDERLRRQ